MDDIRSFTWRLLCVIALVACSAAPAFAQDSLITTISDEQKNIQFTRNNLEGLGRLREIHAHMAIGVDTGDISTQLNRIAFELDLLSGQFAAGEPQNNVRVVRDIRSEIDRLRIDVEELLNPVSSQLKEFELKRTEVRDVLLSATQIPDSMEGPLASIQRMERSRVRDLAMNTLALCDSAMLTLLYIQDKGIRSIVKASIEHDRLTDLVIRSEKNVLQRRSKPLWYKESWETAPFGQVFVRSYHAVVELFIHFGSRFWRSLILFRLALALLAMLPFRYLRRTVRGGEATPFSEQMHLILRYPIQVGTITALVITPLLFRHVPIAILDMFFIGMLFPMAHIFVKENAFINRVGFYAILVYYVLLKASNVLLELTAIKHILLLLVVLLLPRAFVFLKGLMKSDFAHKGRAKFLIHLVAAQALAGWTAHLLGWYRLGNNLITVALECFFLAIALHIVVTALYEYFLLLADRSYRRKGSVAVSLVKAKRTIKKLLDLLALVFWVTSYLKAMDLYELVQGQALHVLNAPHELATIRFTWGSILLFVGVLAIAFALSELLKQLFQDDVSNSTSPHKARGFVLLMRLALMVLGLFLAMNLAGIPLDRITVVVGALGVGIGFGLQNLTNNLVSGIMLALERPVRPGDVIDVKGSQGTVLDIGVRSTRVMSFTGSTLIVPNGMLISELVSNRTLSDRSGEVLVKVNVPVNADMEKILGILGDIARDVWRSGMPEPSVNLVELGRAWALIEVRSWIADVAHTREHRTEILARISKAFRSHGIDLRTPPLDPSALLPDAPP